MAKQVLTLTKWDGGLAGQEKRGIAGSARFIKNLNLHEDDSHIVPSAKLSKVSGSTVAGLVKWAVDGKPWDTNRYFYAEDGKIYKETSGGVWSEFADTNFGLDRDGSGQGLAVYNNVLWWASSYELGHSDPLSAGSSVNNYVFYPTSSGLFDQVLSGGSNTYTLPTSINESATHRQTFVPTKDPLSSIYVVIAAKGTGNWTITVHDASDIPVGTLTVANASLSVGGNYLTPAIDSPWRVNIGDTYHFHLTSTVADGTVTTATSNDLETADFKSLFSVLVYDPDFHPMIKHLNMLVIGNERYAATYDGVTYTPNAVTFEPGVRVRSLTKIDEFVVFGCWIGTNIDSSDAGKLYFWDGISPTFNFSKDVPMGVVNALASSKNRLLGVYGSSGRVYLGAEDIKQIGVVPKLVRGKKIEVFPGAVTNWQGQTVIGFGANTDDSTGVEQGAYVFGSQDDDHPEVLSLNHTISTGTTQGTGLEIGCVAAFGADMYVGWRDGSTYGVDKVSKTSGPNTSGSWESLITDGGNPRKDKLADKIIVTFEPLESGESVTPKYKIDRAANFTNGTTVSTVGATSAELLLDSRFKEFEWGYNVATSTTFPKITSTTFLFDDLATERND